MVQFAHIPERRYMFNDKPREERRRNSRNWKGEKDSESGDWIRWCENCSVEFRSVSMNRKLCTKCVCMKYGIDIEDVSDIIGGCKPEAEIPEYNGVNKVEKEKGEEYEPSVQPVFVP